MSVHGPDPAFVGKAENLCGNMMFAGGMAKMRVAQAPIVSGSSPERDRHFVSFFRRCRFL